MIQRTNNLLYSRLDVKSSQPYERCGKKRPRTSSILGKLFLFLGVSPSYQALFSYRSPEEVARIDRLAEEIGIVQDLRNSDQPILNVTLLALDAPPVFVRTKALRALGQIVTSDPTILTSVRSFHL